MAGLGNICVCFISYPSVWFRSYQVHKISVIVAGWPWPFNRWPWKLVSIKCTWNWV